MAVSSARRRSTHCDLRPTRCLPATSAYTRAAVSHYGPRCSARPASGSIALLGSEVGEERSEWPEHQARRESQYGAAESVEVCATDEYADQCADGSPPLEARAPQCTARLPPAPRRAHSRCAWPEPELARRATLTRARGSRAPRVWPLVYGGDLLLDSTVGAPIRAIGRFEAGCRHEVARTIRPSGVSLDEP